MARVCEVTGKGPMVGNKVSHANNRTFLGRDRKPLDSFANFQRRFAFDRQKRYWCRARRLARTWPGI